MANHIYNSNDGLPIRAVPRGGQNAVVLSGCTTEYRGDTHTVASSMDGITVNNRHAVAFDKGMASLVLSGCSTVYRRA